MSFPGVTPSLQALRSGEITQPGVRVYKSAVQSIATSTWTTLAFDLERFDSDGLHDLVTNNSRLTVPTGKGGLWMVAFGFFFTSNTVGLRASRVIRNGNAADVLRGQYIPAVATGGTGLVGATLCRLAAGDYVQLECHQASGGNLDVESGVDCEFEMARIGL